MLSLSSTCVDAWQGKSVTTLYMSLILSTEGIKTDYHTPLTYRQQLNQHVLTMYVYLSTGSSEMEKSSLTYNPQLS